MAAAKLRGIDISNLRGRQVDISDFETFDMLLAMDRDNLALLQAQCPDEYQSKLELFLSYGSQQTKSFGDSNTPRTLEVPDPYYGNGNGFELVLDLIDDASVGLLNHVQNKLLVPQN